MVLSSFSMVNAKQEVCQKQLLSYQVATTKQEWQIPNIL